VVVELGGQSKVVVELELWGIDMREESGPEVEDSMVSCPGKPKGLG
jgi:hypothetical protein